MGGTCPAPDDLLLTAAEVMGDADADGARAELDDQSRLLFAHAADRLDCATRLTAAMTFELGYRADATPTSAHLSLPQVVATRTGHPLLIAVVAVALLRRAGHAGTVCRAGERWMAAACGSPLVVLEAEPGPRPVQVRPVCGHVVGFAALSLLRETAPRPQDAERCAALLRDLPIGG